MFKNQTHLHGKSSVLAKEGTLTPKQGISDSTELFRWRKLAEQGIIRKVRKKISILLIDGIGNAATRWELGGAWLSKYDSSALNAKGNYVAIELLK
jgi:phage tail-like protein